MNCSKLNEMFNCDGSDWLPDDTPEDVDWSAIRKEKQKGYRKTWADKNPDYQKQYQAENKESIAENQKLCYLKRKEERGSYWYENTTREEYNKKQRESYHRRKRSMNVGS